jgi:hypothetical protein
MVDWLNLQLAARFIILVCINLDSRTSTRIGVDEKQLYVAVTGDGHPCQEKKKCPDSSSIFKNEYSAY